MSDILLEVNQVTKNYYKNQKALIKHGFKSFVRQCIGLNNNYSLDERYEFSGLKNVNFSARRGESIALLGANGAGKSTLLKLINGTYLPDQGAIHIKGKLEALIELGAGFHPLLTGRENIEFHCALKNFSDEKTAELIPKIIEFSELEDFIDMPVKNYSSGMYARLGFSAAVFSDPDILLLDEVLSVGDFNFKQKCLAKMNELKEQSTVLFVSHNIHQVKIFCDRAILMHKGEVLNDGPVNEICDEYMKHLSNIRRKNSSSDLAQFGDRFSDPAKLSGLSCRFQGTKGENQANYEIGEKIKINFTFKLEKPVNNLIVGIPVYNDEGKVVTAFASDGDGVDLKANSKGEIEVELSFENILNDGTYTFVLSIMDGPEYLHRDILEKVIVSQPNARLLGDFYVPRQWKVEKRGES